MTRRPAGPSDPNSRILGAKAFAAITAVEGLKLGAESRKRLETPQTPAQKRAEVLRVYGSGRTKT